ncbi:lycopene cyclase domain-containing protein [Corynebacterium uterequi]|uniref:Lycopene cyclase domain n=1 Tax=Corynebacterium uterequi TaxID=1072256 RepID=A0A0G3HFV6_9CORY|nr:lycopene cyclase domain-containing protein [Corynebacterium uterequi]AKK10052.1 lycopene cyclase domain [Corynebacterium uterequi]
MGSLYLLILLVTLGCMVACDARWKLAFFLDARRAGLLSAVVVALLLAWDVAGIATGTFARGDASYMTGILLAPEMPVEEPVFLFFLSYLLLNLTSAARRLMTR